jgi:putative ABC transport system permease protein
MIRVARLRTSLRFLLRSLDLRASSFLLALLSIVVGVSVAATGLALRADLGRKMSRELRSYGPNLVVTPSRGDPSLAGPASDETHSGLDESRLRAVERVTDDAPGCPILYSVTRTTAGGATIVGLDFTAARTLFPFWRLDGAWPEGETSCLVGSRLAARLGRKPGDALLVSVGDSGETSLSVAGVVSTGESEEEQVLVPLPLLQRLAGRPGVVSVLALRVEGDAARVEDFGRRVQEAVPGVEARPLRQVAQAEGRLLGKLDLMMTLLGGLILLMSGLCVMTTLISMVVEREPEIGLMRALGSGDAEIVFMLFGEATLLGTLGGLLGWGLGALYARGLGFRLFGAAVEARPEVIPAVMGIAVALCWIGTILPLRRALSIQPATALRGE